MAKQNIIWKPNPGPQTNAFTCDTNEVMFGGGRGCVHPDTLLDTPLGQWRIKDFPGGPIYSYKEGKVIITYATPPVQGSKEDMYEVTLTSGKTVICTDEHKFLTKNGWKTLQELDLGSTVVSSLHPLSHEVSPSLLQSIEESYLPEFLRGAQRSMKTLEDSQESYSEYHRRYGQQLLKEEETDPIFLPPLAYAQQHNYHAWSHSDVPTSCGTDTPSLTSLRASSQSVLPFEEERSCAYQGNYTYDKSSELLSEFYLAPQISPSYKNQGSQENKLSLQTQGPCFLRHLVQNIEKVFGKLTSVFPGNPFESPKEGEVADDSIVSIRKVNPLKYWDLHVPETNCYFANGILHHNSGKSSWMYGKVLQHIEKNRGKSRMIFFRENFDDLDDLISKGKDVLVEHGLADYIAGQNRVFRFKGAFAGATLKMRQIEHIDDLKKYKGHEYTLIGFDEICDFKLPFQEINDRFMACLRNPHGIKGQIIYTGNPGGYNHQAVKQYFIDPWPTGNRILKNEFGQTRAFFQSTVDDNPHLAHDEDYMRQLDRIKDPALRRAWRNGDWSVALGAMFSDVWSPNKHVLERSILPQEIPHHFDRYRCFDWGSSTPFCYLRAFVSTGEELMDSKRTVYPAGSIVFYNEYYGWAPGNKVNEGVRMSSSEVAKEIRRREVEDGDNVFLQPGPADNQIFQVLDGTPIYDAFFKEGVKFVNSIKSAGSNVTGWELIRNRLIGYEDKPQVYFTRDCVHTIRTLPTLSRHKIHLDRLADYQEDHAADCIKYLLLSLNATYTPDTRMTIEATRNSHERMVQQLFEEDY